MSLLGTAAVLPRVAPSIIGRAGMSARQLRGIHVNNVVGNNTPFPYSNRRAFTISYWTLMSVLFATPFIAAKYQLIKSGH